MKALFLLIIFGVTVYIGAVELVKTFGKDDNGEPLTRAAAAARVRRKIRKYVEDNIGKDKDVCSNWWKILPGMSANGCIIPADAEKDFFGLLDAFETSFMQNHYRDTANIYLYVFNVYKFKPDITDPVEIFDYLSALAEADVQKVAHRLYPNVYFPPLTSVYYKEPVLSVRIAQNKAGVEEVAELRANLRRSIAAANAPKEAPDIEV